MIDGYDDVLDYKWNRAMGSNGCTCECHRNQNMHHVTSCCQHEIGQDKLDKIQALAEKIKYLEDPHNDNIVKSIN